MAANLMSERRAATHARGCAKPLSVIRIAGDPSMHMIGDLPSGRMPQVRRRRNFLDDRLEIAYPVCRAQQPRMDVDAEQTPILCSVAVELGERVADDLRI